MIPLLFPLAYVGAAAGPMPPLNTTQVSARVPTTGSRSVSVRLVDPAWYSPSGRARMIDEALGGQRDPNAEELAAFAAVANRNARRVTPVRTVAGGAPPRTL